MAESAAPTEGIPKPKKSVALSGVVAGNTALCTVGRTGNDLHYRGYDILDMADVCEFEEIAYLLVHEKLPTVAELAAYKARLKTLRAVPQPIREILERIPAAAHPMDVMRTAVSALGALEPESAGHNAYGARAIADRLMASLGSMLLYWHHWSRHGKRIEVETADDSIGGHFLHLLHGSPPPPVVGPCHAHLAQPVCRARIQRVDLYRAGHRRNGLRPLLRNDRRDRRAARPKHGGANEFSFEVQRRYGTPDEAERDIRRRVEAKEVIIGFGHPVYTVADPRNEVIKEVARKLSQEAGDMKMFEIAERIEQVMSDAKQHVRQPGLVFRRELPHDGSAHRDVYAALRHLAHLGLVRACDRAAERRQDHSSVRKLHRSGRSRLCSHRRAQVT